MYDFYGKKFVSSIQCKNGPEPKSMESQLVNRRFHLINLSKYDYLLCCLGKVLVTVKSVPEKFLVMFEFRIALLIFFHTINTLVLTT